MNLCIEHLLRTKSIEKFLFFPINLFLENKKNDRCIFCFSEDLLNKDKIFLKKYFFIKKEYNKPLLKKTFVFNKKNIFDNKILESMDFSPINYKEQSVETNLNSYNHPMENLDYIEYNYNFLNSNIHRKNKKDWLWSNFINFYFKNNINFLSLYFIEHQKRYVKLKHEILWQEWKRWHNKFIIQEKIAPELIFFPCFNN